MNLKIPDCQNFHFKKESIIIRNSYVDIKKLKFINDSLLINIHIYTTWILIGTHKPSEFYISQKLILAINHCTKLLKFCNSYYPSSACQALKCQYFLQHIYYKTQEIVTFCFTNSNSK